MTKYKFIQAAIAAASCVVLIFGGYQIGRRAGQRAEIVTVTNTVTVTETNWANVVDEHVFKLGAVVGAALLKHEVTMETVQADPNRFQNRAWEVYLSATNNPPAWLKKSPP